MRAAPLWLRASALASDRDEAADLSQRSCRAYLEGGDVEAAYRVLEGMQTWVDPDRLLARSMSFSRPVVFDYAPTPRELQERAERVWQALVAGVLPPPRIERFALGAAGEAHQRLESRASTGSLVLVP